MRVLLVGAINLNSTPVGGEEYKNQLLVRHLPVKYRLKLVDTHRWKSNPWILLLLFYNIFCLKWDRLIISASSASAYKLIRLLSLMPKKANKSVYLVIGGYFPEAIKNGIFDKRPYSQLHSVIVEGNSMKKKLDECGIKCEVHVLPNFKEYPDIDLKIKEEKNDRIKFVFVSRIHPDKGVNHIIEACNILNGLNVNNFDVTFFGPIEEMFRNEFLVKIGGKIRYEGILNFMNDGKVAYNILSGFDAMLFPTYWHGEGFPGAIVDAFIAGLPVIASDWNMNTELIQHGVNGLLIPPKDPYALAEAMNYFIQNREKLVEMSIESKKQTNSYLVNSVMPELYKIIEK